MRITRCDRLLREQAWSRLSRLHMDMVDPARGLRFSWYSAIDVAAPNDVVSLANLKGKLVSRYLSQRRKEMQLLKHVRRCPWIKVSPRLNNRAVPEQTPFKTISEHTVRSVALCGPSQHPISTRLKLQLDAQTSVSVRAAHPSPRWNIRRNLAPPCGAVTDTQANTRQPPSQRGATIE